MFTQMWGKPEQIHSFVAAFIGGYLVFGNYNKVNEQVSTPFSMVLYYLTFRQIYVVCRV